ncbi:MAG TPA: hypothetical protein VMW38_22885 [Terriglobia bacterium]|nr:hypothetical protein [Terriglobia bacterium]
MAKTAQRLSRGPYRLAKVQLIAVLAVLAFLGPIATGSCLGNPSVWVPARWDGGPLEVARRAKDKAVAENGSIRKAIAEWYDPTTLSLLEGTPINCLILTFMAEAEPAVQRLQLQQVKDYAMLARKRGITAMGIVYPGLDPRVVAAAADEARLDGLVLDGDFPSQGGFAKNLEAALRSIDSPALVIPIARNAALVRRAKMPLLAVTGVRPNARDLADMGIRAGPSAEPWIDSNIWLVRSIRMGTAWRPIWIDQQPNSNSQGDYLRCVADSAVAGGRWLVALDDELRSGLFRRETDALAIWKSVGRYLAFAEDHAEWRSFAPYGNLGIILDTARQNSATSDEYLNLVARRQVPYRVIERSQLNLESLLTFRAILAADLVPPSETERKLLQIFAENGGLVVAGPSWGGPPKENDYAEFSVGKGHVVVYKDDPPDPEMVARDMLDLLEPEAMGLTAFNVPSVLTYASNSDSGKRALIQMLNYATTPFNSKITIRLNGNFKVSHLFTPEDAPIELPVRGTSDSRTEVAIPKLAVWGALLLE